MAFWTERFRQSGQIEYLQTISDETKRLTRLVRRMLEISRLQSSEVIRDKQRFDICESMRCAIISMEKKITDRGLDVSADIPDEPVWVLGDPDLITQVIYNLIENATKFAPKGSTLQLALGTRNGKALVAIRNEGETIPPEELPLLFNRFHKSDKSRSRTRKVWVWTLYCKDDFESASRGNSGDLGKRYYNVCLHHYHDQIRRVA